MFKTGYFKADLADNAWNNHRKNKSLCKKILEWFDHYFPKNVDGLSNDLWGKKPLNVSDFSICFYTFNWVNIDVCSTPGVFSPSELKYHSAYKP